MLAKIADHKLYRIQIGIKRVGRCCVILLLIAVYFMLVDNYVNRNICLPRGTFFCVSLLYGCLVVLLGGYKREKQLNVSSVLIKYGNKVLFILIPIGAFYVTEVIYNPSYYEIAIGKIIINYVLFLVIQLAVYLIGHNFKGTYIFTMAFAWIYGIANYYVMVFKGNPLLPSDLLSYRTAMTVASNYTFDLSNTIVIGTLLFLGIVVIVLYMPCMTKQYEFKQKAIMIALGVLQLSLCVMTGLNIKWVDIFKLNLNTMVLEDTYYNNGGLFAFLLEVQTMIVSKPEGYSGENQCEILSSYEMPPDTQSEDVVPSVIVIMNESFADLRILGEFESDEYMANLNNMTSYIMRGNTYASVVGGGTCNSEFEFLTGNTMANFSGNVYPYQMYNFEDVPNLAESFLKQGYETVAIHPAPGNNWSREKVYQQLGFEDFVSIEDMQGVQNIRSFPSDVYNYQQIIEAYENKEDPIFIFNVTMQNHGGYTSNMDELDEIGIESEYQKYKDVIQYLSLVKESDRAFTELLAYFSSVDEPVIICMFGDHQPAIDEEFVTELLGEGDNDVSEQEKRYITPYVIWSNYETEIKNVVEDMSLNYLGAHVLEMAGIETPYFQFLLDMQQNIPVINRVGYQTASGDWSGLDTPNDFVDQYRSMQYYVLFDNK